MLERDNVEGQLFQRQLCFFGSGTKGVICLMKAMSKLNSDLVRQTPL